MILAPPSHHARTSILIRTAFGLCLALLALLAVGCDGDDDDGGGGGPTDPQPFVTVTTDADDGGGSFSVARNSSTEGANLVLDVLATEVQNVRTVDFVLTYPGTLLRPTTAQGGDFLGLNAAVITTALDQNRLQVLMTRAAATGASGSGTLLTVRFEALAPGTGRLELTQGEAADPVGLVIPGIEWLGGDVEVSP